MSRHESIFSAWTKGRKSLRTSRNHASPAQQSILLVDPAEIYRIGLRKVLSDHLPDVRVFESSSLPAAVEMIGEYSPDLVVIDTGSGGWNEWVDSVGTLRRTPGIHRILACTSDSSDTALLSAVDSGVDGVITKATASAHFLAAVRSILEGGNFLPPEKAIRTAIASGPDIPEPHGSPAPEGLTIREREILAQISRGLTDREIGETLFISHKTVHNHRVNIMRKLDLHKAASLASFAVSKGLVDR